MDFGYARTSTKNQKLGRQIDALKEYGVNQRWIYSDQYSGTTMKRAGLDDLIADLKEVPGKHRLIVKEIDRLGRNKEESKGFITRELLSKGHSLVVLDMPYVEEFLSSKLKNNKTFTDKMIESVGDMIIDILLLVAEEERNKIVKRTGEGLKKAKAAGKKLGRKKIIVKDLKMYYELWVKRQLKVSEVCQEVEYYLEGDKKINIGISRRQLYRELNNYKELCQNP